ncbi:MAG: prepilin-type N-terminal cleavage/methylation domain-containing protein [Deltaproteobacteria bacterium]|nr:prepilin-type N-terminal cleavage/methylation domain-containing protein [Deltaproteobacteria bacterium]
MKRYARNWRRGVTLIESVVAVGVLGVGAVILFGAVGRLQMAQRSMRLQAESLEILGVVTSEIAAARCDVDPDAPETMPAPPDIDLGLSTPVAGTWVETPVAGSSIQTVGATTESALQVSYRINPETPVGGTALAFDIDVRIRERMGNAAQDASDLESGYWIRIFPVKKVCDARSPRTQRGSF